MEVGFHMKKESSDCSNNDVAIFTFLQQKMQEEKKKDYFFLGLAHYKY